MFVGRPKGATKNRFLRSKKVHCKNCKSFFRRSFAHLKTRGTEFGHFCSRECYWKSLKGKPSGKKGTTLSLETRKKISDTVKRVGLKGPKHPAWIDGRTGENRVIRESMEYSLWRREVYKKNNCICQICKIKCKVGNIVAHHIKSFSKYPELRFDVKNGITLCISCHRKLHETIKRNEKNYANSNKNK